MKIKTEACGFNNLEIKNALEDMDSERSFTVDRLVFYPYYFFEYHVDRKSFFHPLGKAMGCTVDGINGVGALIDTSPNIKEQNINSNDIIRKKIDIHDAMNIAKSFLYESIAYKVKVLSMPKLHLIKQEIFYRPFWIAKGGKNAAHQYLLTVDAVTGRYHPL